MNPAFSVIFLTTLIGAGQGLFLALYAAELAGFAQSQGGPAFLATGALLALALCGVGLIASFFHLGHPERAWRAVAMWRTSWLSREVIILPAFMAVVFVWMVVHAFGGGPTLAIGALATLVALALFLSTAMIYASIRFIQEWASSFTLVNYLLLGSASGLTLATALAAWGAPALQRPFLLAALVLTVLGAVSRGASLVRNARLKPRSTLQTAIGIKHPQITQRSQGMMGGAFNTREFFHGKSATVLRQVKWVFIVLAFAVPALMLATGPRDGGAAWFAFAFLIQYVGLLAERWYFFAQANHPQNMYYQVVS